ncbi:MAG: GHKL domain-containing protein [Oscillospiraceae bacterium]|jgi:hypothetical protein|nr:GHKL domain-containing protein [Oscillospiraceae bacterium]
MLLIAGFISAMVLAFSIIKFTEVFFEQKKPIYVLLIISFVLVGLSELFSALNFNIHAMLAVLVNYSTFFIVTMYYKTTLLKRLAAVASIFLLSSAIRNSLSLIFLIFPIFLFDDRSVVGGIIIPLIEALIIFIASLFLRSYFSKKKIKNDSSVVWVPVLVVFGFMIILGILMALDVPNFLEIILVLLTYMALFLPLYIAYNLTTIFDVKMNSALTAQEKEYYFAQCRLMQESVENTKSIRHDMQLHLATVRDFIANDKSGEAENHLNGLIGDIERNELYSNTKNTAFDSIINFKLRNAKQDNIQLDLRLLIPPFLNIEVADIVIIIGNLLDNALDAVSKVDERSIKLDIEYSRESLFIQIENSFDGVVRYSKEIGEDDKRILTRKDGSEHGHGLKNIRKSVEKYNGHFNIIHEDNAFSAVVLLYVDDPKV